MTKQQACNYYKELKNKYIFYLLKIWLGHLSEPIDVLVLKRKKAIYLAFDLLYQIQWNQIAR